MSLQVNYSSVFQDEASPKSADMNLFFPRTTHVFYFSTHCVTSTYLFHLLIFNMPLFLNSSEYDLDHQNSGMRDKEKHHATEQPWIWARPLASHQFTTIISGARIRGQGHKSHSDDPCRRNPATLQ